MVKSLWKKLKPVSYTHLDVYKRQEPTPFEMYYEYSEEISKIPAHRILAINRGEKEKVLSVKIVANEDKIITYLQNRLLKNNEVTRCV